MSSHAGPANWWTIGTNEGRTHIATKGVVQSGLVLNLDASVNASYTGTGTTLTDLSGNGNTGTLINGPTYSSANGGSIVFDGVNDSIDCGSNSSIKPITGITVSAWIKINSVTSNSRILSDWHQGSGGDRWIFYCANTTTVNWWMTSTGQSEAGIATPYTFTPGVWTNLTGTYNNITQALYVNGIIFSTAARTGTMYAGSSGQTIRIGQQAETGGSLNGNVSNVHMYNRALTAAEVQRNFNALRGRYGI